MREFDDVALELRLRGVLREHLGALPLDLTVDALDRRREARRAARRRGGLVALGLAAAILVPLGVLGAGGRALLEAVVVPVPSASPPASPPAPTASPSIPYAVTGPTGSVDDFTSAPDLSMPMVSPTLVPLLDGRVLVIGDHGDGDDATTRALLYDPATGVSESTGPLVSSDSLFVGAAVRLEDGRVLVIGRDGSRFGNSKVQVFDPESRQFAPVGPMITPRRLAAVTLLPDGHVLIAGGFVSEDSDVTTNSAELLDPATLTFSPTGSMEAPRALHSMVVLPDGRVFVSPGIDRSSVEIYDPGTGTFSGAGTTSLHGYTTAIALPDGRVALVERRALSGEDSAEVWDPRSLSFSPRHDLPGRPESATLLQDGRILLIGGEPANWSGIYDPTTGLTTRIEATRAWGPTATRLADGRVLVVGGRAAGEIGPDGGVTVGLGVPTVEILR